MELWSPDTQRRHVLEVVRKGAEVGRGAVSATVRRLGLDGSR